MEASTLLNYCKPTTEETTPPSATKHTENIEPTDEEPEQDDEPFFDLEFTLPKEDDDDDDINSINDSESEFEFTLSPSTNVELNSTEPNSKLQFTSSLLKSASKFRLFMLGLNKSKPNTLVSDKISNQQQKSESQKKKLFTVKFKVDEVPFVSFFTSGKTGKNNDKASQENHKTEENTEESKLHSPSSDEKIRFSKEVMQKYLKKVKPLYVKVSQKYAEKLRLSGQLNMPPVKNSTAEKGRKEENATENGGIGLKGQKQGTLPLPAGLRIVCKHLGKSRSVLSPEETVASSRRQDDSVMQQQDGIQSAILHCKSSFNGSKECDSLHYVEKSCK